ncbi:uncharacterized protein LOC142979353 [Anticarsia gemmatalis]|uniref:uncharacterized protein LOC142979353 n=1 Tax=Anticarsia gemmatalis TaxID=129554 RepID=UPI003F77629A
MSPLILLILAAVPCFCQRPFYAGQRPIGFPAVADPLEDRFGDQPIPASLNGDRVYANKLSNMPVDQQPYFFVNRDQIAEHLKNPQTYPQRPSVFNENRV